MGGNGIGRKKHFITNWLNAPLSKSQRVFNQTDKIRSSFAYRYWPKCWNHNSWQESDKNVKENTFMHAKCAVPVSDLPQSGNSFFVKFVFPWVPYSHRDVFSFVSFLVSCTHTICRWRELDKRRLHQIHLCRGRDTCETCACPRVACESG